MNKKKEIRILILLLFLLFAVNYYFLDGFLKNIFEEPFGSEIIVVDRVIDGDTIYTGNTSIRLLGINTPEKGEPIYNEAKKFLENLTLNKTLKLEYGKEKYDRYKRILAYVFLEEKNVNLKMIENGYANPYFPSGKNGYYSEFFGAWKECINKNINLCEKSADKCADCIELKELDVDEQKIVLYNKCDFGCSLKDWNLKDEGRKKFVFSEFELEKFSEVEIRIGNKTDKKNILFWKNEEYVWTESGDSLFLRDEKYKLVLWENY